MRPQEVAVSRPRSGVCVIDFQHMPKCVEQKCCSEKFPKTHIKTPTSDCLFS